MRLARAALRATFAASLFVLAACSGAEPPPASIPDTGLVDVIDASEPADVGTSLPDAMEVIDTGLLGLDATEGAEDARPFADADVNADTGVALDADAIDTGLASDAGQVAPDASQLADTGVVLDAGVPDSGALDAGQPAPDAGTIADAGVAGRDAGSACTSTQDCIPGVEVCSEMRVVNNRVATYCRAPSPVPPAQPVGGACTTDGECGTNMCLDGFSNECTVACADAQRDCPSGFACVGYNYTPGPVWIFMCSRGCEDDGACAAGNPGNVCSSEVYQRANGTWALERVCSLPLGAGTLGAACTTGNDCRSGLCLTTTRTNGCTSNAGCNADETCTGGSCISRLCSGLCNDDADCATPGQSLVDCRSDINLSLPDGQLVTLSSCGRP
ncbi:hypothetical protein L6R52_11610 [Myxococcota bacterium]|nr:hypothetical protein [Myxococcota bacterium]